MTSQVAAVATGDSMLPWLEKYRPIRIVDIVGNSEVVERLNAIAEDGNMPNLILSGPPGTGKTTSVHCLARALLGDKLYKEGNAVLELNASDERGIDVVRNRIKLFAQKKVSLPPGRHKVVILDEADAMTSGAQHALRRTMELHSSTTRFALACNISSKIIEPIQSRCAILRYSRLSDSQILDRLLSVAIAENVSYTDGGLEAIIFTAEGDMRQALNNLQSAASGFGDVTEQSVFKVCDQPHPLTVKSMIVACLQGYIGCTEAQIALNTLVTQGYAPVDIISTIFKVTKGLPSDILPEALKLLYLREISVTHMRIVDGAATHLQLAGLIGRLTAVAQTSMDEGKQVEALGR